MFTVSIHCIYLSTVSVYSFQSCLTLCDPMDYIACQAPLSMGFSRQEYWSGLPCPPPVDLPHPGIKPVPPVSPALQADSFLLNHLGSPSITYRYIVFILCKLPPYLLYIPIVYINVLFSLHVICCTAHSLHLLHASTIYSRLPS